MTTSTSTGRAKVDIREPGHLLASLPYLLGFRPAESVVLLGHRAPQGNRVGLVLRADLPPLEYEVDQAVALASRFGGREHLAVTLVVVAEPGGPPRTPPHTRFVDLLEQALGEVGRPVLHALWTPEISAGAQWGCYREPDCHGEQPDGQSTVAAATFTELGKVTYGSREELEELIDPLPEATLVRRAALLAGDQDPPWGERDPVEAGSAEVREALARVGRGDCEHTDDQAVRLARALSIAAVRDACLSTAVPAGTALARDAETLWITLVRALPAPQRAAAACLLGYAAYVRGDGAFAGMALANAREADPGYLMAELLAGCLERGVPPSKLTGLGVGSLLTGPGRPGVRPAPPGASG